LTLCNKKLGIGVACLLRSTSCQWFFKSMNQNKEPPEGQWWGCLSWWPDHWAESILSLPLTFAAIIVNAPKKRLFSLSLTGKIMQEANHLSNTARQESGPSSERTLSHNAVPVNWVNWLGSKFQHCVSHFQSCALCFIRKLQKVIAQISHFLQACRASEFTCPVEWLGDVWFTMILIVFCRVVSIVFTEVQRTWYRWISLGPSTRNPGTDFVFSAWKDCDLKILKQQSRQFPL
jgi:hypothetical protein